MRTTLTLDDDLARILRRKAADQGLPFKDIINATLRSGLANQVQSGSTAPVPVVKARDLGFRTGIDLERLNQLADELEAEEFARRYSKQ